METVALPGGGGRPAGVVTVALPERGRSPYWGGGGRPATQQRPPQPLRPLGAGTGVARNAVGNGAGLAGTATLTPPGVPGLWRIT
ncbi:hypothetical protein GCM10027203_31870 [Nonomuraea fastidiosa]